MRWIASAGGPLVLMPSSRAAAWDGVDGPPGTSDYDRACAVFDYAGVLEKDGIEALVLGDEPLRTAFYEGGERPALVRWRYAPGEPAVLEALARADFAALDPVEEIGFAVREELYLLWDAAARADGECLEIRLVPGSCRVLTYQLEPSREVAILVHRFL